MQDKDNGEDVQRKPVCETSQNPIQSSLNQDMLAQTANNQQQAIGLERDIKVGEWWLICLGVATIAVNIFIACIYYGQLNEMRKATQATRDAVDVASRTLGETQRSNATQAALAQQSLKATIDQFRLDQRAWIGPRSWEMRPMNAPNPIKAQIVMINSGKTPAMRMKIDSYLHVSDGPIDVIKYAKHPIEPDDPRGDATSSVLPGGTFILFGSSGITDALGIESVKNGRKLVYFFASVEYFDVFGIKHHTRLCALYQGKDGVFGECPGNYDHVD